MEVISKKYDITIDNPEKKYLGKNTCFLDIETTGFSRQYNTIYMIGLARVTYNVCNVTLLFAKSPDEEQDILEEFIDYSKDVTDYISFNGLSFDFPFIKARMNHFGLDYDFKKYNHLDIYKECKTLKSLLKLNNLKQKTIEAFLGLERDDKFSGGELINQYNEYVKYHNTDCYKNLITHNLEDVKGMADILIILRYTNLSQSIEHSTLENVELCNDNTIKLSLLLDTSIPKRISFNDSYSYIILDNNKISVILTPVNEELRYYLQDYKNYVYIAKEDMIIPKQLLNATNKKYAIDLTREKCYISHTGIYLPVYNKSLFEDEKLFRHSFYDKNYFVDITSHIKDREYMRKYTVHLIKNYI